MKQPTGWRCKHCGKRQKRLKIGASGPCKLGQIHSWVMEI